MKYLCPIYLDEEHLDSLSKAKWNALVAASRSCLRDPAVVGERGTAGTKIDRSEEE